MDKRFSTKTGSHAANLVPIWSRDGGRHRTIRAPTVSAFLTAALPRAGGGLEAAERAHAKVIANSDPRQLASVQAGGWLAAVGRRLRVLRPTEVMRQRDPAERRALDALHDRDPDRYLKWADGARRIETFGKPADACEHEIAEWTQAMTVVGPEHAVMIARENDTREALNRAVRELQRGFGALGEERSYGGLELAVGDRVICRHNNSALFQRLRAQLATLPTRQLGRVEDLDGRAMTLGTQREQLAERLAESPVPRRRLGREHDLTP